MQEHHFTLSVSFEAVAAVLRHVSSLTIRECSDLHVLAALADGGLMVARPVFPHAVEVIVAEDGGDLAARSLCLLLTRLLDCEATTPAVPTEPVLIQHGPGGGV